MIKSFSPVIAAGILAFSLTAFATPASAEKGGAQCEHNYFAAKPCIATIHKWQAWADRNGLPRNAESARVFQAYAKHDYRTGDRLLARLKGVSEAEVRGSGLRVVRLVEGYAHAPVDASAGQSAESRN